MNALQLTQKLKAIVETNSEYTTWTVSTPHLLLLVKHVVEEEREACAEICDRFQARDVGMQPAECAAAIRARGNT